MIATCRYLGALVVGAVDGASKQERLSDHYSTIKSHWKRNLLTGAIAAIAMGFFKKKHPPEIQGTGYVVHSLEAALWAFYRSNSFREGLFMAVNLGGAADTTGAMYDQSAGAYYGEEAIPASWRSKLVGSDLIESFVRNCSLWHRSDWQVQSL